MDGRGHHSRNIRCYCKQPLNQRAHQRRVSAPTYRRHRSGLSLVASRGNTAYIVVASGERWYRVARVAGRATCQLGGADRVCGVPVCRAAEHAAADVGVPDRTRVIFVAPGLAGAVGQVRGQAGLCRDAQRRDGYDGARPPPAIPAPHMH